MGVTATLAVFLLTGMVIALAMLAREYFRLKSKHSQLSKAYANYLDKFENVDLIYTTFFKDALEKSMNREELIEYFRSEMELVYKRSTIGEKGDNYDLYSPQEMLDVQTCSIIRQIVRPWMPEIDVLAGKYYEKYASSGGSGG